MYPLGNFTNNNIFINGKFDIYLTDFEQNLNLWKSKMFFLLPHEFAKKPENKDDHKDYNDHSYP